MDGARAPTVVHVMDDVWHAIPRSIESQYTSSRPVDRSVDHKCLFQRARIRNSPLVISTLLNYITGYVACGFAPAGRVHVNNEYSSRTGSRCRS